MKIKMRVLFDDNTVQTFYSTIKDYCLFLLAKLFRQVQYKEHVIKIERMR